MRTTKPFLIGMLFGALIALFGVALFGTALGYFYLLMTFGNGIWLDEGFQRVKVGQDYGQVVAFLGPEQGSLGDELIRLNLRNRYGESVVKSGYFRPCSERGGRNLLWLNRRDNRSFNVVSFDEGGRV